MEVRVDLLVRSINFEVALFSGYDGLIYLVNSKESDAIFTFTRRTVYIVASFIFRQLPIYGSLCGDTIF